MSSRFYLDFNAHHPVAEEVRAAISELLGAGLANPSSVHAEGRRARRVLEEARSRVARLIGGGPERVIFTSGGTEGNAAALWGLLGRGPGPAGRRLVVSAVEHPSVFAMARELARLGAEVRIAPVDRDGVVDVTAMASLVAAGDVIAVQLANSETGVMQPVERVVDLARRVGAEVHCDAIQAAGKVELRAAEWGVTSMAIAAHKFGGVPGAGALYTCPGAELAPLIPGTQEGHRRGGTENLLAAVGMGVAADLAASRRGGWERVRALRDRLEEALLDPGCGIAVYGTAAARLPNTSCLGLPEPLRGGSAVAALDLAGFAVSSGSACSSGVERGSPVVEAMGHGTEAAERSLRISLGGGVSEEAVDALAAALRRLIERSRGGAR
ncbi:MAG: cysteine desulfurase family protein [Acidobacteriota bacterium]